MNSFETDLKRAFFSVNFLAGLVMECVILRWAGFSSDIYQISVPVLASLPYSTPWLNEYQGGFIKQYLPRCGMASYIWGKFLSCGISGGTLLAGAYFFCSWWEPGEVCGNYLLIFLSGMFWAVVSATLAAAADSRYVAYGGSFVLFYTLVIFVERYFKALYCLDPREWYAPEHAWVLGDTGIVLMLAGVILISGIIYSQVLKKRIMTI
ncbi:MAG: hypothetical protein HFH62_05025 [Lachnospiraceae bacterium]|nr:hypothetical protein [Lachnospiraceae bacterium]